MSYIDRLMSGECPDLLLAEFTRTVVPDYLKTVQGQELPARLSTRKKDYDFLITGTCHGKADYRGAIDSAMDFEVAIAEGGLPALVQIGPQLWEITDSDEGGTASPIKTDDVDRFWQDWQDKRRRLECAD